MEYSEIRKEMSPIPWRVSDAHGLCIVDKNGEIVVDLTPRSDWRTYPLPERLRANAEIIVMIANDFNYVFHGNNLDEDVKNYEYMEE